MRISDWSSDVCSSDLNAVYGKAGFRNAGGENNLAHASFSGANGSALVRRVERTVQLVNDDSRWQSIQPLGSTFYLGHAWQKSEQIAALLLQRVPDGGGHIVLYQLFRRSPAMTNVHTIGRTSCGDRGCKDG